MARALPDLAGAVRAARQGRGWSQGRLALEAQTSQPQVWRIESGADVRLSTLLRLLQVLGLTVYITSEVESPHVAA